MARHGETRERVLRAAAELFQHQGYGATGLNQVVERGAAPKGSLYFHFPGGKEQLAAEAVALAGGEIAAGLAAVVRDAPDVRAAITAVGELFADTLEKSGFRAGCPVATVALEAAAGSEPIRAACDSTYEGWVSGLAAYLESQGVANSSRHADLVVSAVQGALLLARVRRDATVIRTTAAQVADVVAQGAP